MPSDEPQVDLDINDLIKNFSLKIADLTSSSIVNQAIVAKLKEENKALRRALEGSRESTGEPATSSRKK